LINELIHDNRKQLQSIRQINERVKGQCLIANNKLVNRQRSFTNNVRYYKARGDLALSEKAEAMNMQTSRKKQAADYAAYQSKANAWYKKKSAKLVKKLGEMKKALGNVEAAIKAVQDWTPKNTAFIQEQVNLAVDSFHQIMETPVSYDQEMIQLAASDKKIRRRLYQWLSMLKASFISTLSRIQSGQAMLTDSYSEMNKQLSKAIKLENSDAVRLGKSIKNWTLLIKNYGDNEKIYTALQVQTENVLKANKEWCKVESANYSKNKGSMEEQLKVFVELKLWLRKNYSRVRQWIRKRYNR